MNFFIGYNKQTSFSLYSKVREPIPIESFRGPPTQLPVTHSSVILSLSLSPPYKIHYSFSSPATQPAVNLY